MSDLRKAIKAVTGKEPDEIQIQRLMAVAHALEIPQNDAMIPILCMLDSYHGLYKGLPAEVARNCKAEADAFTKAAVEGAKQTIGGAIAEGMKEMTGAAQKAVVATAKTAAEAEKANAVKRATQIAVVGVLLTGIVFGTAGYLLKTGLASSEVTALQVALDKSKAETAKALDDMQTARQSGLDDQKAADKAALGWAGSDDAIYLRKAYDSGAWTKIVKFSYDGFIQVEKDGQSYCARKMWTGNPDWDVSWLIPHFKK